MVILADHMHCGFLGEGLIGFDWGLFLGCVCTEAERDKCAFKTHCGLTLSSGKLRGGG